MNMNQLLHLLQIIRQNYLQMSNAPQENHEENADQKFTFINPVCRQTYNSLPKIYGSRRPKKAYTHLETNQTLKKASKHSCLSLLEEQRKKKLQQASNSKSKYRRINFVKNNLLSLPKKQKCLKKSCQCNLVHQEDGDEKLTKRKDRCKKKVLKNMKLRPLNMEMPDDFQSTHKVRMNTEPICALPTGLSEFMRANRKKKVDIQGSGVQQSRQFMEIKGIKKSKDEEQTLRQNFDSVKIGFQNKVESSENEREQYFNGLDEIQVAYDHENKLTKSKKINKSVEIQVNLNYEEYIEKIQGFGKNSSQVNRSSLIKGNPQLKGNDHNPQAEENDNIPQFEEKSQAISMEIRQTKIKKIRQGKFYENLQPKSRAKIQSQEEREQLKKSRKSSSSSISLSSCIFKSLKKSTTQFHKLNSKQKQEKLKGSRIKSVNSRGFFRIPSKQQCGEYLKGYRILDPKFSLKELVKKPLFTIVEEEDGVYFGEYENDQKNGSGINVTERQIFEGTYQNNVKVRGCERNIDGVYRGYFQNGRREGYGTFEWNNGEVFEGNWKNGVKEGFGIWKSPKGDSYEGEWHQNRQHGRGKFKHKSSTFVGQFENFLKSGRGEQRFANGDKYIGDYKEGKPHGKGVYTWADGNEYEGSFQKGIRMGFGVLTEDGNIYEGEFRDDFKHGEGKLTYKSGQYFIGQFVEGIQTQGTLYGQDGKFIEKISNS